MLACKETAILHLFALAAAALVFRAWNLREHELRQPLRAGPLLAAVAHFPGIDRHSIHLVRQKLEIAPRFSYVATNACARGGQGHQKPFWYYGQLLTGGWSGGLLFAFACVGLFIAIQKRDASPYQWLAYYGLFIAAIYSLIPYKTPWLALNLWLPLAIFAGMAVESLWRWTAAQFWQARGDSGILHPRIRSGVDCSRHAPARLSPSCRTKTIPMPMPTLRKTSSGFQLKLQTWRARDGIKLAAHRGDCCRSLAAAVVPAALQQVGFWQPGQQVADADFYITSTEAADQYADQLREVSPGFLREPPRRAHPVVAAGAEMNSHG